MKFSFGKMLFSKAKDLSKKEKKYKKKRKRKSKVTRYKVKLVLRDSVRCHNGFCYFFGGILEVYDFRVVSVRRIVHFCNQLQLHVSAFLTQQVPGVSRCFSFFLLWYKVQQCVRPRSL